jgi:hypothetical protein
MIFVDLPESKKPIAGQHFITSYKSLMHNGENNTLKSFKEE